MYSTDLIEIDKNLCSHELIVSLKDRRNLGTIKGGQYYDCMGRGTGNGAASSGTLRNSTLPTTVKGQTASGQSAQLIGDPYDEPESLQLIINGEPAKIKDNGTWLDGGSFWIEYYEGGEHEYENEYPGVFEGTLAGPHRGADDSPFQHGDFVYYLNEEPLTVNEGVITSPSED